MKKGSLSTAFLLLLLAGTVVGQIPTLPLKTGADREAYRTIVRRLAGTRMTVSFEEDELQDVVRQIARQTRLNLILARPLRERESDPVTMSLKNVRAITLVNLLRESLDIEFQHRHGVLRLGADPTQRPGREHPAPLVPRAHGLPAALLERLDQRRHGGR